MPLNQFPWLLHPAVVRYHPNEQLLPNERWLCVLRRYSIEPFQRHCISQSARSRSHSD